jgi:hypothetical protein
MRKSAPSRCLLDCKAMRKKVVDLIGKSVVVFTPDLNKTTGTLVKVHGNAIELCNVTVFRFEVMKPRKKRTFKQAVLPFLWINQIGAKEKNNHAVKR